MRTYLITPSVINEKKDGIKNHTLSEDFYGGRWAFAKLADYPYSLFSYGCLLVQKTGLDCTRSFSSNEYTLNSVQTAPAYSEVEIASFNSEHIRIENFPSTLGGDARQWTTDSEGLCVMLPGLNASPMMFADLCDNIKDNLPRVDFYTPDIRDLDEKDVSNWSTEMIKNRNVKNARYSYETGIYDPRDKVPTIISKSQWRAERHALVIMDTINHYLELDVNPKKIVLLGFSKGTQIQSFVDYYIKKQHPHCKVLFIAIGGIFHGTTLVNNLDWCGLGFLAGTEEQIEEMKSDSPLSVVIREKMKTGGNINHEYHFIGTKADEYVLPFTSSLPILTHSVYHHVHSSASHTGVFLKSIDFVTELINKFYSD